MPTATIVLKRDNPLTFHPHAEPMTHEEFKPYTVTQEQIEGAMADAKAQGLTVLEASAARRSLRVSFDHGFAMKDVPVEIILVDGGPVAKPRLKRMIVAHSVGHSYTAAEIAKLYNFPAGDGEGQTVALIELGGFYSGSDVTNVFVDGVTPASDGSDGADGEVALDIQVVQGVAPKAKIIVFYAPNTAAGFYDAISTAIHTPGVGVISISWGGPEDSWQSSEMSAYDNLFQSAAALGIVITVASGDSGSSDGESGNHVDFPASSPHALACGGTRYGKPEVVWDDQGATGGGFSTFFPVPSWQQKAHRHTHRGVPDVSGNADPYTGYQVTVDGEKEVVGGTSAVAPLWAGLIALMRQQNPKLGWINAKLYGLKSGFNDITSGNNGTMKATKGWDACTGLGTPNGEVLTKELV